MLFWGGGKREGRKGKERQKACKSKKESVSESSEKGKGGQTERERDLGVLATDPGFSR